MAVKVVVLPIVGLGLFSWLPFVLAQVAAGGEDKHPWWLIIPTVITSLSALYLGARAHSQKDADRRWSQTREINERREAEIQQQDNEIQILRSELLTLRAKQSLVDAEQQSLRLHSESQRVAMTEHLRSILEFVELAEERAAGAPVAPGELTLLKQRIQRLISRIDRNRSSLDDTQSRRVGDSL